MSAHQRGLQGDGRPVRLPAAAPAGYPGGHLCQLRLRAGFLDAAGTVARGRRPAGAVPAEVSHSGVLSADRPPGAEHGRASFRDRVCSSVWILVVPGSLKKTNQLLIQVYTKTS